MASTYRPSLEEVRTLAAQGNLIPVYRELPADLETPVSVYLKLCGQGSSNGKGPSFLLESVEKGEQLGRYSFIGVHPPMTVAAQGDQVTIGGAGGTVLETCQGDPLRVVKELMAHRTPVPSPGLPRFTGGVVGYFGYDLVRFMERLPATARTDLHAPDAVLLFADNLVVFDHVRHKLIVSAYMRVESDLRAAYADAVARIDQIIGDLRKPLTPPLAAELPAGTPWQSNVTQEEYERRVLAAKEHIAAGDIFQVVLSQRLSRRTEADPFTIYRALRMLNPSPYMFFLGTSGRGGHRQPEPLRLIGSSPEMHVRLEDGKAHLRPIAGTRWRGERRGGRALAAELLADPKERAEHVMLVDLGRNDLGRVCEYGSVHTCHDDGCGALQPRHAHRQRCAGHAARRSSGRLQTCCAPPSRPARSAARPRCGPWKSSRNWRARAAALCRLRWATSTTTAPMDTCIAIRTMVMQGQTCHLQAGARHRRRQRPDV
jgi:anthranilate synthase component 1